MDPLLQPDVHRRSRAAATTTRAAAGAALSASGRLSAGILLFREREGQLQVLIGHPGGPFWAKKQEGAWSVPKGLVEQDEDPAQTALREFEEETGFALDPAALLPLGSVVLKSGKEVVAWGVEGDLDPAAAASNTVTVEWPRGSGRLLEFPEVDEVRWCSPEEAMTLLNPAQRPLVERLQKSLDHRE